MAAQDLFERIDVDGKGNSLGPFPQRHVEADQLAVDIEQRSSRVADRKSTRLNSSHPSISYAVFCLKKKKQIMGLSILTLSRWLMTDQTPFIIKEMLLVRIFVLLIVYVLLRSVAKLMVHKVNAMIIY